MPYLEMLDGARADNFTLPPCSQTGSPRLGVPVGGLVRLVRLVVKLVRGPARCKVLSL